MVTAVKTPDFTRINRWKREHTDAIVRSMLPEDMQALSADEIRRVVGDIPDRLRERTINFVFCFDEKLTPWDVEEGLLTDPALAAGAVIWLFEQERKDARGYITNQFLHDMVDAYNHGGLTCGQLKGVMNFMRAKALREYTAFDEGSIPNQLPAGVDFTGIIDLLVAAKSRKVQYPKIRLALPDGSKVVLALAGSRSKQPGSVNITDGGPFGANEWYGRINTDGTASIRNAEVKALLEDVATDPAAKLAVYGKRFSWCCFCGRELVTNESLAVGYGPVCADNWGLPWGAVEEAA